jgi:heme-degrading monooxygenase HmoA
MFARVTSYSGTPEKIERALETYREQVLPWVSDATGFRGLVVLLDRDREEGIALTFWADEASLRDNVASGAALRDEIAEAAETPIVEVRSYEVIAADELALDESS